MIVHPVKTLFRLFSLKPADVGGWNWNLELVNVYPSLKSMSNNLPGFLDGAAAYYIPLIVPIYLLFSISSISVSGYYCPQSIDNL